MRTSPVAPVGDTTPNDALLEDSLSQTPTPLSTLLESRNWRTWFLNTAKDAVSQFANRPDIYNVAYDNLMSFACETVVKNQGEEAIDALLQGKGTVAKVIVEGQTRGSKRKKEYAAMLSSRQPGPQGEFGGWDMDNVEADKPLSDYPAIEKIQKPLPRVGSKEMLKYTPKIVLESALPQKAQTSPEAAEFYSHLQESDNIEYKIQLGHVEVVARRHIKHGEVSAKVIYLPDNDKAVWDLQDAVPRLQLTPQK